MWEMISVFFSSSFTGFTSFAFGFYTLHVETSLSVVRGKPVNSELGIDWAFRDSTESKILFPILDLTLRDLRLGWSWTLDSHLVNICLSLLRFRLIVSSDSLSWYLSKCPHPLCVSLRECDRGLAPAVTIQWWVVTIWHIPHAGLIRWRIEAHLLFV